MESDRRLLGGELGDIINYRGVGGGFLSKSSDQLCVPELLIVQRTFLKPPASGGTIAGTSNVGMLDPTRGMAPDSQHWEYTDMLQVIVDV
jgi:hypothetical protein